MDDGDCDAAIAAVAAAVIHVVQSLIQEVGSGDKGPGLYGLGLPSAETHSCWLEEEQKRKQTQRAYPRAVAT